MTLDEVIKINDGYAIPDVKYRIATLDPDDAFLDGVINIEKPKLVVRTLSGFCCNHEDWIKRAAELGFPQNSGDTED